MSSAARRPAHFTLTPWPFASTPPPPARANCATSAPPRRPIRSDIEPLPGIEKIPAPEEDGDTFLANAATKAIYYSRFAPGELVVADDSGLEVDALGGAPGVRSARFAADAGLVDSPDANDNTDVWNNMLLLQRLAGIPATLRTARYHCTLVAARDGEVVQVADGAVEGVILDAPRGTGGFGYDPLFYLPELGKTMAEIDLETKLSLQPSRPRDCGAAAHIEGDEPDVQARR